MDIRTFFVTQDRKKSTDSVKGAAAQESIDSVILFVHASPIPPPQPSTACCACLWFKLIYLGKKAKKKQNRIPFM